MILFILAFLKILAFLVVFLAPGFFIGRRKLPTDRASFLAFLFTLSCSILFPVAGLLSLFIESFSALSFWPSYVIASIIFWKVFPDFFVYLQKKPKEKFRIIETISLVVFLVFIFLYLSFYSHPNSSWASGFNMIEMTVRHINETGKYLFPDSPQASHSTVNFFYPGATPLYLAVFRSIFPAAPLEFYSLTLALWPLTIFLMTSVSSLALSFNFERRRLISLSTVIMMVIPFNYFLTAYSEPSYENFAPLFTIMSILLFLLPLNKLSHFLVFLWLVISTFWVRPYLPIFLSPLLLVKFFENRKALLKPLPLLITVVSGLLFSALHSMHGIYTHLHFGKFLYSPQGSGAAISQIIQQLTGIETWKRVFNDLFNPWIHSSLRNFLLPQSFDRITLLIAIVGLFLIPKIRKISFIALIIPLTLFLTNDFYPKLLWHLLPLAGFVASVTLIVKGKRIGALALQLILVLYIAVMAHLHVGFKNPFVYKGIVQGLTDLEMEALASSDIVTPFLHKFLEYRPNTQPHQWLLVHHEPGIDLFTYMEHLTPFRYVDVVQWKSYYPERVPLFASNNCESLKDNLIKYDLRYVVVSWIKDYYVSPTIKNGQDLLLHEVMKGTCGGYFQKIWTSPRDTYWIFERKF